MGDLTYRYLSIATALPHSSLCGSLARPTTATHDNTICTLTHCRNQWALLHSTSLRYQLASCTTIASSLTPSHHLKIRFCDSFCYYIHTPGSCLVMQNTLAMEARQYSKQHLPSSPPPSPPKQRRRGVKKQRDPFLDLGAAATPLIPAVRSSPTSASLPTSPEEEKEDREKERGESLLIRVCLLPPAYTNSMSHSLYTFMPSSPFHLRRRVYIIAPLLTRLRVRQY